MIKRFCKKISNFLRGTVKVIGTLIGVKWTSKWNYDSLAIAGWVFILGFPFGVIALGQSFSLFVWLAIVATTLMLINIDDALLQMTNYLTYGVDGEVEAYEEKVLINA